MHKILSHEMHLLVQTVTANSYWPMNCNGIGQSGVKHNEWERMYENLLGSHNWRKWAATWDGLWSFCINQKTIFNVFEGPKV